MKKISLIYFIRFGALLQHLLSYKIGSPLFGEKMLIAATEEFLTILSKLDLLVSKTASSKLAHIISDYKTKYTNDNNILSANDAADYEQVVLSLRDTIFAEVTNQKVMLTTPKRIDINFLLYDVPKLFNPGAYDKLNELCRYDISESAKCIAYEIPTAAAFHILRATENILKTFYKNVISKNRVHQLMWANMVQDLQIKIPLKRNCRVKEYNVLLCNLDYIRVYYRNPTQHPEKIYSLDEVQSLWNMCVEVINHMSKYI